MTDFADDIVDHGDGEEHPRENGKLWVSHGPAE